MARLFVAVTLLLATAVVWAGTAVTPAEAHYPAYIVYHYYKYYRADYYDPTWCIYHHKYIYCRHHGGGDGGGY